nr:hypothetical protein ABT39_MTgene4148 [Picea glauca]
MRLGFIHVTIRMRLPSSYRHFYRNVVSRPIIMAIKCAYYYYIVGVNEGFVLLPIDRSIDGFCLLLL